MLNDDEYKAKQQELEGVARSIEIYKQTPQTKSQKAKVNALFENWQADSFAHECAYLNLKLAAFKEILAVMKS